MKLSISSAVAALAVAQCLFPIGARAQTSPPGGSTLVRGPYLQLTTQSNTLVRWRTKTPATAWVRFGLSPLALSWEVGSPTLNTNHSLTLTNLAPDTRYFYAIGTGDTVLASGQDCRFTTAPAGRKPTRIWAIGDSGTASVGDYGSWLVRDAYMAYAGERDTDVWLMLGDNAYGVGTDAEFQVAVFETYPALLRRTAVWSTLGNHETYAPLPGGGLSYFDIFEFPTQGEAGGVPSGTERYYSFDHGGIHFVCIDSELSDRSPGSPMLTWLESDLAANTNEWIIAYWHSPPYTKGSHDSDNLFDNGGNMTQMRVNVNPILESHGVDLVLSGHSHNYERSYPLSGHYGFSWELTPAMILDEGTGRTNETGAYLKATAGPDANRGTVYIVNGSSGWATFQTGFHPAMHIAHLNRGSVVIDIDDSRMDVRYLRDTGAIDDHFTVLKGAPAEPLRFTTIHVANGIATARWKSVAGVRYKIEQSTSVDSPVWTPISEEITASGATTTWSDIILPEHEKSFFRVVVVD